jgi:hypothetical protein
VMSEVKPTLVQLDLDTEGVPVNSWVSNFPSGKWIDAQSRGWYWIMVSAVSLSNAYEYRIRFDSPVENMTLIFPYVVKTTNDGIKKVFIKGVEYQVRSKQNYGDRFVVSGQEFSFKVATEYKLDKRTIPILMLEYKQAVFKSVEFLGLNYIRLSYTSSDFKTVNTASVDYVATRNTYPIFTTSKSATCNFVRARTTSSTFNNINSLSVPVIANCRDTSWARFGGIWSSCDTWMPLT